MFIVLLINYNTKQGIKGRQQENTVMKTMFFLQKLLFFPEAEKILEQLQDSVLLSFGTLK